MPKAEEEKALKDISTVAVTLKVKDKATAEALKVYTAQKYDAGKKEITFDKKVSPPEKCWRVIHNGADVLMFFESDGETHTVNEMFCGTKEECEKEIDKLGLKWK